MSLKDKKILITGSSAGIGKAIAEEAISLGAQVVINGRNQERLEQCAKELNVKGFVADVGQEKEAQQLASAANEHMGGIDILVNNAGWGKRMPLDELDPQCFEDIWRSNVLGPAQLTHHCLEFLYKSSGASIVNIASTAAKKGYANGSAYCSSKFALRGMTECWQAELRPKGIRVILINPSEVQTGFGGRDLSVAMNPNKLFAKDIALSVCSSLEMPQHALIPELTVFATNPWAETK